MELTDKQRIEELEKLVTSLIRGENPNFIENVFRRMEDKFEIPKVLADLRDVSATTPSTGEVLEWNGSSWTPATDNT